MKKGKIDATLGMPAGQSLLRLLSLLGAISFMVAGAPHADAEKFTSGTEQAPLSPTLKTGDYVYRNGVEIGRAQIGGVDATFPSGSYAYAALAITLPDGSRQWQALGSASGSPAPDLKALEKRLVIPQSFLVQARAVVSPGTTLIVTDQPVDGTTQSGSNFNILTTSTTSSTQPN
jgi:hypothetical protein